EIRASSRLSALVALGDSITDGLMSPSDRNLRYPDVLARLLAATDVRLAVQIEAISGNQVLRDAPLPSFPPNLLDRLHRDPLAQAAASAALLTAGPNDIR